ncbi:glutamate-1-semialdehyde 2,1-aminomutase [Salsuginibacillus halophilus]|uniref:Glutamate-1-semialdehyde 2,1-aminomutase n=1 Tax=Salsuginibacillus halophilus TaxID=517424 RepID=A0A2P8HXK2_9BACI|nr:aspartate aminotransferase family protein [Salsuginibacillus halophilus]PSL50959.1 glutamate-1-semialdehyde 2,1-aminomutase [Salsuginibacillus halophilus]
MAIQKLEHPVLDYVEQTKASQAFMEEAESVMPGGVTANIKHFAPHPIAMKHGKGARITDMDDNEYLDYLLSYGALMTGHGHPHIKKAMIEQMEDHGTWLFGAPHELEVKMGKKLQELYPSMEKLRYTNSGTEATLLALRVAAAYTGKHKVAKFEGHYHGGYDQMLVSVSPNVKEAGSVKKPNAVLESKGMHSSHERNTVVLPFNDLESAEKILRWHKDEIGAMMIEPLQSGYIPAEQQFLDGLASLAEELGILLIFDEVKTCFRLGLGGAQERYGIKPDLTALGKVVGGGFPVGIVGGREDVMEVTSPNQGADVFDSSQNKNAKASDVLFHSGTYNGHPMIMAAGLATIEVLEEEIEEVFQKTEHLKRELERVFAEAGIPMKAVGEGSIFSVVLTEKETIRNYRDLQETNLSMRKEIDMKLLQEGIYTKPLNRYSLSTEHTWEDIQTTIQAYERVLLKR